MPHGGYAADTTVSEEKTRAEIETVLGRHGATHRAIATDEEVHLAQIAFVIRGRRYRLDVPLPAMTERETQRESTRGRAASGSSPRRLPTPTRASSRSPWDQFPSRAKSRSPPSDPPWPSAQASPRPPRGAGSSRTFGASPFRSTRGGPSGATTQPVSSVSTRRKRSRGRPGPRALRPPTARPPRSGRVTAPTRSTGARPSPPPSATCLRRSANGASSRLETLNRNSKLKETDHD